MSKAHQHKKYLREEKAAVDRKQTKFSAGKVQSIKDLPVPDIREIDTTIYCPFCLHKGKLKSFFTLDVKGEISDYKVQCPECDVTFLMQTAKGMRHIFTSNKIDQYAKWVAENARGRNGFWAKASKEKLDKRLRQLHMSTKFWDSYKKWKISIARPEDDYND
jgi:transcription elongation factor Elf1